MAEYDGMMIAKVLLPVTALGMVVCLVSTCSCANTGSTSEEAGGGDRMQLGWDEWQADRGEWFEAGKVSLDPSDSSRLAAEDGHGAMVNGWNGDTVDLHSRFEHGDVEAHIEFMVPEGSNSGVYFQSRYEIQVFDSWGVEAPKFSDCGGIYQRWEDGKGFEGRGPRVNASRPPGEWQSFDVIFRAPRFDPDGKKVGNARFERVLHNGVLVHRNVEVSGPTRASSYNDEAIAGPLMLQGDHGPVAYRNIWVRSLPPAPSTR